MAKMSGVTLVGNRVTRHVPSPCALSSFHPFPSSVESEPPAVQILGVVIHPQYLDALCTALIWCHSLFYSQEFFFFEETLMSKLGSEGTLILCSFCIRTYLLTSIEGVMLSSLTSSFPPQTHYYCVYVCCVCTLTQINETLGLSCLLAQLPL